jgi:hypothetical protein
LRHVHAAAPVCFSLLALLFFRTRLFFFAFCPFQEQQQAWGHDLVFLLFP